MKALVKNLLGSLKSLHKDEQGATMAEYMLVIGGLGLPLLFLLYWFRDDVKDWLKSYWENTVKSGQSVTP